MKHSKLILVGILFLAFVVRVWQIAAIPPALNWDEVSHGYNAYSILKTGRDEWGIRFPLLFRAYGDFKLPLYIYLTVIPTLFFGLSPLAVRLVSVLAGVGIVGTAYLTTKHLTGKNQPALLAAFLTTISPWTLFLSRIALEANLAAFLFALGFYYLLLWKQQKSSLLPTVLLWGLALYAYNSARIVVPLFGFCVFLYAVWTKRGKTLTKPLFLTLVFLLPVVYQFARGTGTIRFSLVTLVDQGAINQIIEKRQTSPFHPTIQKLLYNRPTYFIVHSAKNYLTHFSPNFLFFEGGSHYQFSFPSHGLLFLVTLPFLLLGIIWVVLHKKGFIALWLLLAFIPSSITREAPHVLRSCLILPLPFILTSLGLFALTSFLARLSKLRGKLVYGTLYVGILIHFLLWWRDYSTLYPKHYSWAWQYGYKEAASFIQANYSTYDQIIVSKKYGEPHEFLLFYTKWDPHTYQTDQQKVWDWHANWYWVDAFANFQFWNDWEIGSKLQAQLPGGKTLLVTSPSNYITGGHLVKTISFLDGSPAFDLVEYDTITENTKSND